MRYEHVLESVCYIRKQIVGAPKAGVILGRGLGCLAELVKNRVVIPYGDIPHFPRSGIAGHAGNLVYGEIGGCPLVMMQGRFHYYEGFEMDQVTYPLFVMKLLGVEQLIVTNASGGINPAYRPGDLILLEDYINFSGVSPLRGGNDERFGPRFPDMSEPYSREMISRAERIAGDLKIPFHRGVYLYTQGPNYETAAEIRAFSRLGADLVGMSTVPETIVAGYLGLKVLGIACVTNMATGIATKKHAHEAVMETADKAGRRLCTWVQAILDERTAI